MTGFEPNSKPCGLEIGFSWPSLSAITKRRRLHNIIYIGFEGEDGIQNQFQACGLESGFSVSSLSAITKRRHLHNIIYIGFEGEDGIQNLIPSLRLGERFLCVLSPP